MASFKQAVITSGAELFIENVTGEPPIVTYGDVNKISWQPGQAKKFADYLMEPSDIGVEIDTSALLVPLLLKKGLLIVGAYTALIYGATKFLGKRR